MEEYVMSVSILKQWQKYDTFDGKNKQRYNEIYAGKKSLTPGKIKVLR